jgi:hypothetical protein
MLPPKTIDVLDEHGGFTAVTKLNNQVGPSLPLFKKLGLKDQQYVLENHAFDTLWRPGLRLKQGSEGKLEGYIENSFYQLNEDVTLALYSVPGYHYLVACWFDNETEERIA